MGKRGGAVIWNSNFTKRLELARPTTKTKAKREGEAVYECLQWWPSGGVWKGQEKYSGGFAPVCRLAKSSVELGRLKDRWKRNSCLGTTPTIDHRGGKVESLASYGAALKRKKAEKKKRFWLMIFLLVKA